VIFTPKASKYHQSSTSMETSHPNRCPNLHLVDIQKWNIEILDYDDDVGAPLDTRIIIRMELTEILPPNDTGDVVSTQTEPLVPDEFTYPSTLPNDFELKNVVAFSPGGEEYLCGNKKHKEVLNWYQTKKQVEESVDGLQYFTCTPKCRGIFCGTNKKLPCCCYFQVTFQFRGEEKRIETEEISIVRNRSKKRKREQTRSRRYSLNKRPRVTQSVTTASTRPDQSDLIDLWLSGTEDFGNF